MNWGPAPDDSSVRLYEIYNTAHNSLLVLAIDRSTALKIAYSANHILSVWDRKDRSYPHISEVKVPSSHRKIADRAPAIELAISQRLQGTVHFEGGGLRIGSQVVSE